MKIISPTYFRDSYIQKIIDNFEWDKIHEVMKFLNWTWAGYNGVPSIEEMKKDAIMYLKEAYNTCLSRKYKNGYSVGSGGLIAESFYDDKLNKITYLELRFVLDSWFIDEDSMDLIDKKEYN